MPDDADYVIWGGLHAPNASNNRFWFQVDDGPFYKWRISVGDIWFWDDLHNDTYYGTALHFSLARGAHGARFANCADGVWLDRLYLTPDGDVPRGNDTRCSPPHSIALDGGLRTELRRPTGTRCGDTACAGLPPIDAYDCAVGCRAE